MKILKKKHCKNMSLKQRGWSGCWEGLLFAIAGRWQLVPSAASQTRVFTTKSPWGKSGSKKAWQGSVSRRRSRIVLVHTRKLSHPEGAGCLGILIVWKFVVGKILRTSQHIVLCCVEVDCRSLEAEAAWVCLPQSQTHCQHSIRRVYMVSC